MCDGKRHLAHRFSWIIYFGSIPNGLHVLHHCDIPKCVNPEHLFLGTQSDNMNDMHSKGRHEILLNEAHPNCRYTNDEVVLMRILKSDFGITPSRIALLLNANLNSVKRILYNQSRVI